jgi:hypothetical protein
MVIAMSGGISYRRIMSGAIGISAGFSRFGGNSRKKLIPLFLLAILAVIPPICILAESQRPFDTAAAREVTVTAHVFSGVPDPSWKLTRKQISELARRIGELEPTSSGKPLEAPSRLGYRGFSITIKGRKGTEKTFFVYDNLMDLGDGLDKRKDSEHSLEKWLLTAGHKLRRDVRDMALNDLNVLVKPAKTPQVGAARVTLNIFSGVPDPSWELTPDQANVLSEKIQALKGDKSRGKWEMPSRLGYRGFTVELKPENTPQSSFYLYDNVLQIEGSRERKIDSRHALELWMLKTAGPALDPEVRKVAEKDISELKSKPGSPLK